MEYAVGISLNIIQYFTLVQFFDGFFPRKYQGVKFWGIFVVWSAVFFGVVMLASPAMDVQKIIAVLLMTFILNILLYQGNLLSRIFLSVTSYALFNAVCYIFIFATMVCFHLDYQQLEANRLFYTIAGSAGAVCALLTAQLIKHVHSPSDFIKGKCLWTFMMILFPVSSILILFLTCSIVVSSGSTITGNHFYPIIVILVLTVSNIFLVFLIDTLQKSTKEHEMLVAISEREKMQQESLHALSAAYSLQRSLTHDFRKHIDVLTEFLNANATEEAVRYLNQLHEQQTERLLLVNTHHAAIDAILNQKGYLAQKYNIDIRFEVNDLSQIKVRPIDCTVVIGNLLDNAIEACQKLPLDKRWIQVSVLYTPPLHNESGNIFISVLNPSLPVKIIHHNIATTKPNPSFHGFGLRNVKDTLAKYQAEYDMSYEDGQFVFSLDWPDIVL